MESRARRAAAAVGLAAVVVTAVGSFYLRPWQAFAPAAAPTSRSTFGQQLRTPAARPATVQQMRFVSADLGWVVAGGPASASLFRTTDGGRHWQRQLTGVAGDGWMLWFFDARRGVVYGADQRGDELWRTKDGGQHWTGTAMPCHARGFLLSFHDLDHGWCVSPGTAYGVAGTGPLVDREELTLFRTVDGGGHWSRVLATDQAQPVSGGLSDEGQKAWIWFRDAEVGWIGEHSVGGRAVVYATTDGGDHWDRQELPPPEGGWGSTLGTHEIGPEVVGGRSSPRLQVAEIRPGPQQGQFIVAGQYLYTWRSPAWTGPVLVPEGGLLVVEEADQATWLVANGSSLLESTDAGDHWLTLGQVPTGWVATRLTMVDHDHGWAMLFHTSVGYPYAIPTFGLARTGDGGRDWTLVSVPS